MNYLTVQDTSLYNGQTVSHTYNNEKRSAGNQYGEEKNCLHRRTGIFRKV